MKSQSLLLLRDGLFTVNLLPQAIAFCRRGLKAYEESRSPDGGRASNYPVMRQTEELNNRKMVCGTSQLTGKEPPDGEACLPDVTRGGSVIFQVLPFRLPIVYKKILSLNHYPSNHRN